MKTEYKVLSSRKPFNIGDILIHDSDTGMIYLSSNPSISMSFEYAKAIDLSILKENTIDMKKIDIEQKEYKNVAELFKCIRKRNGINQTTWAELIKVLELMLSRNAPIIDPKLAQNILKKNVFSVNSDLTYDREIKGVLKTKMLIGNVNIKPQIQ